MVCRLRRLSGEKRKNVSSLNSSVDLFKVQEDDDKQRQALPVYLRVMKVNLDTLAVPVIHVVSAKELSNNLS